MNEDKITVDNIVKNLKHAFETQEYELEKDGDKKFYGVVTGTVINLQDPQGLGRVQVQVPFIDSMDLSPWARVAGPMAGIFHGTYFVPNAGDEVLVAFEHGDVKAPYIIGSLWNTINRPPLPSPLAQVRAIRTLSGNQLVFDETRPSITLQTAPTAPSVIPAPASPAGPHQTIMMSPEGIQIMSPVSVQIMVGTHMIKIDQSGISLNSTGRIELQATSEIKIQAPTINIGPGVACSINAETVKIN